MRLTLKQRQRLKKLREKLQALSPGNGTQNTKCTAGPTAQVSIRKEKVK